MDEQNRHFHISFDVVEVTEHGKKTAKDLEEALFWLPIDGEQRCFAVSELTIDILKAEAERLASIVDAKQRYGGILSNMVACIQLVWMAQELGADFSRIADGL
jgi:hypothetical protein